MTDERVAVNIEDLSGLTLDWAVADAIGWKEPFYGVGEIYWQGDDYMCMTLPDPDEYEPECGWKPTNFNHYEQWSPSRIGSQVWKLIGIYDICLAPTVPAFESFVYQAYGPSKLIAYGETREVAVCRAILRELNTSTRYINVPKVLLS